MNFYKNVTAGTKKVQNILQTIVQNSNSAFIVDSEEQYAPGEI